MTVGLRHGLESMFLELAQDEAVNVVVNPSLILEFGYFRSCRFYVGPMHLVLGTLGDPLPQGFFLCATQC